MSVIAWDGRFLVADRMCTTSGYTWLTDKLILKGDIAYAISGYAHIFEPLIAWHEGKGKWPAEQATPEWSRLIVVRHGGELRWTENVEGGWMRTPQPYMAFGAGRDFALGAMFQGANAEEAVLAASALCDSCGLGLTIYDSQKNTIVSRLFR